MRELASSLHGGAACAEEQCLEEKVEPLLGSKTSSQVGPGQGGIVQQAMAKWLCFSRRSRPISRGFHGAVGVSMAGCTRPGQLVCSAAAADVYTRLCKFALG